MHRVFERTPNLYNAQKFGMRIVGALKVPNFWIQHRNVLTPMLFQSFENDIQMLMDLGSYELFHYCPALRMDCITLKRGRNWFQEVEWMRNWADVDNGFFSVDTSLS